MSTIGIIGHGYVGSAVAYGFRGWDVEQKREPKNEIRIYDKYKDRDSLEQLLEESEYIFVCLPTPFEENELRIDQSIIDQMIEEIAPG